MNRTREKLAFNDDIGLFKSLVNISQYMLEMSGHIADLATVLTQRIGLHVRVQESTAFDHRLANVHHGRQNLVLHLNQLQGFLSNVCAGGSHGGNRMTVVQHFPIGQHIGT